MRLYLAGVYTSNFDRGGRIYGRLTDREREIRDNIEWHLESYHYVYKKSYIEKMRRDGVRVFLDSGAFSSFTQGIEVDLGRYCEWIHENEDIIDCASVLDAIGDARGTFRNQAAMERLGTEPLPCFHYGEPMALLDWYVEHYEYITIGGMVPISTPQLKVWLDRLWSKHLCDASGRPKIKVHGFGLTSLPLMMRYPWFSVDSSTWVQWAANGMILVPGIGQVDVSSKSSRRKQQDQHLDTVAPPQKERIESVLWDNGFDPQRLRDEYISRWVWNIWAFPYYARSKVYEGDSFTLAQETLF